MTLRYNRYKLMKLIEIDLLKVYQAFQVGGSGVRSTAILQELYWWVRGKHCSLTVQSCMKRTRTWGQDCLTLRHTDLPHMIR